MKIDFFSESESEIAPSCPTLSDPVDCSVPTLFHPWDSTGKNTGVGGHYFLKKLVNKLRSALRLHKVQAKFSLVAKVIVYFFNDKNC